MTLRDHAKEVIRALAATDHRAGYRRDHTDALTPSMFLCDPDIADACRVLGSSTRSVWLAAYREIEREALLRRWPTAACLIELWERPWSTSALRFAAHQLSKVVAKGLPPVLEHEPLA